MSDLWRGSEVTGNSTAYFKQSVKLKELVDIAKWFFESMNGFDSQTMKRLSRRIRNFEITLEVRRID